VRRRKRRFAEAEGAKMAMQPVLPSSAGSRISSGGMLGVGGDPRGEPRRRDESKRGVEAASPGLACAAASCWAAPAASSAPDCRASHQAASRSKTEGWGGEAPRGPCPESCRPYEPAGEEAGWLPSMELTLVKDPSSWNSRASWYSLSPVAAAGSGG
jgi:hypothetical protein